jgi:transposase
MLRLTTTTVTREHVWTAFRRTHEVRWRERDHAILLLMEGKSCSEIAQWRYREEDTMRRWVYACNEAGLPGLERAPIPGRPA